MVRWKAVSVDCACGAAARRRRSSGNRAWISWLVLSERVCGPETADD
jgi:hypothetical protein